MKRFTTLISFSNQTFRNRIVFIDGRRWLSSVSSSNNCWKCGEKNQNFFFCDNKNCQTIQRPPNNQTTINHFKLFNM